MSSYIPKSDRAVVAGLNTDAAFYQCPVNDPFNAISKKNNDKIYGRFTTTEAEILYRELRRVMTEEGIDPEVTFAEFRSSDKYRVLRKSGIWREVAKALPHRDPQCTADYLMKNTFAGVEGHQRMWTKEEVDIAYAMRDQGMTTRQIATKLNRKPEHVTSKLRELRYKHNKSGSHTMSESEFQDLLNLVAECLLKKKRVSKNVPPAPYMTSAELLTFCKSTHFKFEIDWLYICDRLNRSPQAVKYVFYNRFATSFKPTAAVVVSGTPWSDDDVKQVIRTVYDCGARDMSEISWSWFFPDRKHLPNEVKLKWMQLRKRVMGFNTLKETEIAEKLAEQMKFDVDVYDADEWGPAPTAEEIRELEKDVEQEPVIQQQQPTVSANVVDMTKPLPVESGDDAKQTEKIHKHKHKHKHHDDVNDTEEHAHHHHKHHHKRVAPDNEPNEHKHRKHKHKHDAE